MNIKQVVCVVALVFSAEGSAAVTQTDPSVFVPSVEHEEYCIAIFGQNKKDAYVRKPGNFCYKKGNQKELARRYWPFAALSRAVYTDQLSEAANPSAIENAIAHCHPDAAKGWKDNWKRWEDFPDKTFRDLSAKDGLYLEVWDDKKTKSVVVVMRGTEPTSIKDWLTNLRWVRFTRLLPWFHDQYSVLSTEFAKLFVAQLVKEHPDLNVTIYAAGHSLGGGLAQHFAYSLLPSTPDGRSVPRVAQVFAFNPSPVTGWSSVENKELRGENAENLIIHRIFEHGEILAYPRRLIGYVIAPKAEKPTIWEIRFNYLATPNIVGNHSMDVLTCELIKSAFTTDAAKE